MQNDSSTPRRGRSTGRVTLQDVARAARVSAITVSRALRGARAVDAELVERVRDAAGRLGYVPDPAARALASSTTSQVAVLIPALSNALFVDLLEAVHKALVPQGYQTLIGVTHYDPVEEEQLLRSFLLHRPAGLLVTGFDRTPEARRLILTSRIPCVHVMETDITPGVFSVGFSQRDAGVEMTRHLLATGRRRIAFAAAQLDPRTLQRQEGWRSAMKEAGLYDQRLEWQNPGTSSMHLGGLLFEQIVATRPPVDAIFFCNDDLAHGGLLAALRMGIKVPKRVAIAGFNDLEGSDLMVPPLTTVRTRCNEIGSSAATMLLQLMRGEEPPAATVDVGYELIRRGSA